MKNIFILFCAFLFSMTSVIAQVSFSAKSGDSELDLALSDMNVSAKANLSLFKKDLSVDFNMTEGKIDQLMVSYNMEPADVYMALQVAKQCAKTPDQVAECYKNNKGKGWGVIAKEMGIKPGSKEFHALKDSAKGKNKKMKANAKGNNKGNNGNGKGKKK